MKNCVLFLIQVGIIAMTSCTLRAQQGESGSTPASQDGAVTFPDWTTATKLPRLRASMIKPRGGREGFTCLRHEVRYWDPKKRSKSDSEPTFPTDAEAQAAALQWIAVEFEPLPRGTSLRVSKVLHSASGNPAPKYDWDKGHTVVIQEVYNAIPTIGNASVYIAGKNIFKASTALYAFEPEDSSRELLSPARARRALMKAIAENSPGAYKGKVPETQQPKLEYDRDPHDNPDLEHDILTPTWIMDANGILKVNGFTGRFWVDD